MVTIIIVGAGPVITGTTINGGALGENCEKRRRLAHRRLGVSDPLIAIRCALTLGCIGQPFEMIARSVEVVLDKVFQIPDLLLL